MTDRRVVITGLGVLTPVGNDVETFWSNLKNGVSGIHTIDAFDTTAYDCKIGGASPRLRSEAILQKSEGCSPHRSIFAACDGSGKNGSRGQRD